MALLVHSNVEQGDDSMWIYLPAMDRIKRVDLGSSGGGYFLGSDFTFRDLVSREQTEYEHALLPSDDDAYYVVEVRGRTEELRRTFGYAREEHFVRKDNFMRERIVFYDLAGDRLKELIVDEEHEADGYAFPSRVRMLNHQTGHVSEIVLERAGVLGRDSGPVLYPSLPEAEVGGVRFPGTRIAAVLAWAVAALSVAVGPGGGGGRLRAPRSLRGSGGGVVLQQRTGAADRPDPTPGGR